MGIPYIFLILKLLVFSVTLRTVCCFLPWDLFLTSCLSGIEGSEEQILGFWHPSQAFQWAHCPLPFEFLFLQEEEQKLMIDCIWRLKVPLSCNCTWGRDLKYGNLPLKDSFILCELHDFSDDEPVFAILPFTHLLIVQLLYWGTMKNKMDSYSKDLTYFKLNLNASFHVLKFKITNTG